MSADARRRMPADGGPDAHDFERVKTWSAKRPPHHPRPGMSRGPRRQGLEIILTRSGVPTPSSGGAVEIVLTEMGGADPPLSEGPNGIVPSRVAACRRRCARL